ncbi:MAG: hypothetical protein HRU06_04085 [Oceanospirillaceae bacterium]|nr:hypothetical protein [Oceanospirillaceae bacterium]
MLTSNIITALLSILPLQLAASTNNTTATPLILVSSSNFKESSKGQHLSSLYSDILNRLGYQLVFKTYPLKRANTLANQGVVDGIIHRASSFQERYPEMVRVDEPHFEIVFSAYASQPDISVSDWQALKSNSYSIGYRLGNKQVAARLAWVDKNKLTAVHSIEQGFELLLKNRITVFIAGENIINASLNGSVEYAHSIYKSGELERIPGHLFLHPKHRQLAPKIANILKALKEQ